LNIVSPENRFLEEGKSSELSACLQNIQETTVDDVDKYTEKTCRELARIIVCRTYASAIHELCHLTIIAVHSGSYDHRYEALFFTSGPARGSCFKGYFSEFTDQHASIHIGPKDISIEYADKPFAVTYSRMALLSALMEFLMTSIGYAELDRALAPLLAKDLLNQKQVSGVANDLSKRVYAYLGEHLPPAQEQRKSQSFLRFVSEQGSEGLSSNAIDDEAVLEYWLQFSGQDSDGQSVDVKTYRSVFRMSSHLIRILRYAEDQYKMNGALPIGTDFDSGEIDPSDLEVALNEIEIDGQPLDDLADVIDGGIKIVNRREIETLQEALHGDEVGSTLPLSILRNAVFGDAQAGLIQALRQKTGQSFETEISAIPETDYQSRLADYQNLSEHLDQMLLATFNVLARAGNATAAIVALALKPDMDVSDLKPDNDEPDWGDSNVVSFQAENAMTRFFDRLADEQDSDLGRLAADARTAFKGVSRQGFSDPDITRDEIVSSFAVAAGTLIVLRKELTNFLDTHTAGTDWDQQITIDTPVFQSQFTTLYGGQNG